jgi:hypothetical protein
MFLILLIALAYSSTIVQGKTLKIQEIKSILLVIMNLKKVFKTEYHGELFR